MLDFETAIEWLKPRVQKRSVLIIGALVSIVGYALYDVGKLYLTAGFENLIGTASSAWETEKCERRNATVKNDDNLFTILLSPLQGDDAKRSRTERVGLAFVGENGFRLITLCEPLGVDLFGELRAAQSEASKRGEAKLRELGADLIIFGKVLTDDSLHVWAVNGHGGCHFSPDPITLRNGAMPGEFRADTKSKLIGATLTSVAAACDRQAQDIDWQLFERQLVKLRNFLRFAKLNLPENQLLNISLAYYNGINRLYFNGGSLEWLEEGLSFSLDEANAGGTGDDRKAQAWLIHGKFSAVKSVASGDKKDLESALIAYSRSIQISPTLDALSLRAAAYTRSGEYQRAIRDYDQAIQLKSNDATLLASRAAAYSKTRNHQHAIQDLDQAIRLKPDDALILNDRCYELAKVGRLDLALSDCNRALALRPNDPYTLDSRGFTYLKLGQVANAIRDYDAALQLNPKSAYALYGRGVGKMKYGQTQKAQEDIAAAKAIKADIAVELSRYGLK